MKGLNLNLWGVYSVWRRHAKVYQRTWLVNCLPPVSEPIVYLVAFGYGLTPLVGNVTYMGQQVSYLEFIAPAMVAVGLMFQSFFEGAYGTFIRLNFQKTWHALLTAPLSFSEVFLGDWLWATTKGMIAGLLTATVAGIWGIYAWSNFVLALPLMLFTSLMFSALGLLTAGLVRTVDQVNVPIFLIIIPMFTLCGTYFPRETLPPFLQHIAAVLPLSSVIDLLRFPLGVPNYWWLEAGWMVILTGIFTAFAVRRIYPLLVR